MPMGDVRIPTTDGRTLPLSRAIPPEPEHRLLPGAFRLRLPVPPPKITPRVSPVVAVTAV